MTSALIALACLAQDPVFSGPQKDEKLPPFRYLGLSGNEKGQEQDAPTAKGLVLIVFIHEATRQAAQVLRALDESAAARPSLHARFVLLTGDLNSAEQRTPAMQNSLKFRTPWGLSIDGKEGPGSYGLNKSVTLTILLAKDAVVVRNWAIIAPSDVDAPPIVRAIADLVPADRAAELEVRVAALERENAALRAQVERLQKGAKPPAGKAPTDPVLNGAMRRIVRMGATDEDVDAAFRDIEARLKEKPDLRAEVTDGYALLIDLNYGGEYARKRLKDAAEALKK